MFVSIIIPTRNRFDHVTRLIDDLLKQDFSNFEILVIDQSDQPKPILNCKHITTMTKGPCISRNQGSKIAMGDILVFLDDDARVKNDFISELIAPIIEGQFMVVAGAICNPHGEMPNKLPVLKLKTGNFIKAITSNPSGEEARITWALPAGCVAILKTVFDQVGGFNERFDPTGAGEDRDLALKLYRAGIGIWYNPKAKLFHEEAKHGGARGLGSRTLMLDVHSYWMCKAYFSEELSQEFKQTILKKYRRSFYQSLLRMKLMKTKYLLWKQVKQLLKSHGT